MSKLPYHAPPSRHPISHHTPASHLPRHTTSHHVTSHYHTSTPSHHPITTPPNGPKKMSAVAVPRPCRRSSSSHTRTHTHTHHTRTRTRTHTHTHTHTLTTPMSALFFFSSRDLPALSSVSIPRNCASNTPTASLGCVSSSFAFAKSLARRVCLVTASVLPPNP